MNTFYRIISLYNKHHLHNKGKYNINSPKSQQHNSPNDPNKQLMWLVVVATSLLGVVALNKFVHKIKALFNANISYSLLYY